LCLAFDRSEKKIFLPRKSQGRTSILLEDRQSHKERSDHACLPLQAVKTPSQGIGNLLLAEQPAVSSTITLFAFADLCIRLYVMGEDKGKPTAGGLYPKP
jgi:hypothetical protein